MTAAAGPVEVRVTWLEMSERPAAAPASCPETGVAVIEAVNFPVWLLLSLYDAVGGDYGWGDLHDEQPATLSEFQQDPQIRLFMMMRNGWPQGFYLLDTKQPRICDIAYFGLVGQALGKGLGGWLLDDAVARGWRSATVERLTVNTCTLDHPAALQLYTGRGFNPLRRETRLRISGRTLPIPAVRKEKRC